MDKIGELYRVMMCQITKEDHYFVQQSLAIYEEKSKNSKDGVKDLEKQCKDILTITSATQRFSFLSSMKQYMIAMLKLQSLHKDKPDFIEKFAYELLKIVDFLIIEEYDVKDQQKFLTQIMQNNAALHHLLEFNTVLQEDSKRTGCIKPSIYVVLHQSGGFDKIMQSLYWHLKTLEKVGNEIFSEKEENQVLLRRLITVGLKQISDKYQKVIKNMFFTKVDIDFPAYVNNNLEKGIPLQEYIFNIFLEQCSKFHEIFQALPSIVIVSQKSEELRSLIEKIFELLKRMFSQQKIERIPGASLFARGQEQMFGAEEEEDEEVPPDPLAEIDPGLLNSVIQQLIEMGFTEQRARQALRNIEFPEVSLAMEWLLQHQEEEEDEDDPLQKAMDESMKDQRIEEKQKEVEEEISLGKRNVHKKVSEKDFQTALSEQSIEYTKTLLLNVYSFEGFDKFLADLLIFLLDKSPEASDPKRTQFHELAYILLSIIRKTLQDLYPSIKLKYSFKQGKTPRSESLEKLIQPLKGKSDQESQQLKNVNVILPLLIKVIIKIYMKEKIPIKSQLGFDYIHATELMLKHIDQILPSKQQILEKKKLEVQENKPQQEQNQQQEQQQEQQQQQQVEEPQQKSQVDEDAREVIENFIHRIVVLVEELLVMQKDKESQEKEDENSNKDNKGKEEKRSKKGRSSAKKGTTTKKEEVKTESENESLIDKSEKNIPQELKQCALQMALDIITTSNKVQEKYGVSIVNKYSLQGLFSIITRCVDQHQENIRLFIEKKGLQELLTLRNGNYLFDGVLEIFYKLCDSLISDTQLISATIECLSLIHI
eukprot:TRINITY_DN2008_c0_g1_i8.p1 TRINITY_DN2008_c0_g1~~TRINITY_DN2008_c0_g1_i8.p1  ORF type:complete len:822 (-),score=146.66 TRINITY_DN2008_c0_g1_i8:3-2468(-)